MTGYSRPQLVIDAGFSAPLHATHATTPSGGNEPPGGDPLEARVARLEEAFSTVPALVTKIDEKLARIDSQLDGMDKRFEGMDGRFGALEFRLDRHREALTDLRTSIASIADGVDANAEKLTELRISDARAEERMERIMDRTRDMPSEAKINSLLNHKLVILGILSTVCFALLDYLRP